jgi:hypothetical protein
MRRRRVLALAATSTAAVAGCTSLGGDGSNDVSDSDGDGRVDSQDYAPQDPDVQDKEDVGGSGSSDSTPTESPTSTTDPKQQLRKKAFQNYKLGYTGLNSGSKLMNQGGPEFNDGNYESAKSKFKEVVDTMSVNRTAFTTVSDAGSELMNADVEQAGARGEMATLHLKNAANHMVDACNAEQNGQSGRSDFESAQEDLKRVRDANEKLSTPDELKASLGL